MVYEVFYHTKTLFQQRFAQKRKGPHASDLSTNMSIPYPWSFSKCEDRVVSIGAP